MVEDSCWSTASAQFMRSGTSGTLAYDMDEESDLDMGDLDVPEPNPVSRKSPRFSPETVKIQSEVGANRRGGKASNSGQGEVSLRKLAFEEPSAISPTETGDGCLSIPLPTQSVSGSASLASVTSPSDSLRRKSQFGGGPGGRTGLASVRSAAKTAAIVSLSTRRQSRAIGHGDLMGHTRSRKRMTLAGNHGVLGVQAAVVALYAECLEVARCRLQTTAAIDAPRGEMKVEDDRPPTHAWPHLHVAPLLWLPFSLGPGTFSRFVPTRGVGVDLSKPYKQLVPMALALGTHHLRGILAPSSQDSSDEEIASKAGNTGNHAIMKKLFQMSVSEAKLAQAQAVVAFRDVQSLRAALKQSRGPRGTGGSASNRARCLAGGAGAGAAVAAGWMARRSPNSSVQGSVAADSAARGASAQLWARREQLRKAESAIKATLQEVERQNRRLAAELQRCEAMPCGPDCDTPGVTGGQRSASEQPFARAATAPERPPGAGSSPERPRAASAREGPRQALPTIGGTPPPPATPRATPRAQAALPPTPRRAAVSKSNTGLPHLAPGCHPHMRRAQR